MHVVKAIDNISIAFFITGIGVNPALVVFIKSKQF